MVACFNHTKKKGFSVNRIVILLAKLTFAASFIWTISFQLLLSAQSTPSTHSFQLSSSEQSTPDTFPLKNKVLEPLRETNREIISTAPPVDIAFVDFANSNEKEPHLGAKDELGNFGYRHNETALRNNPPEFKITKVEAKCDNHDGNYIMLTEKVFVDIASHEAREREAEQDGGKPRAKIFCVVYTIQKNHGKLSAIRETWGQKCDGFMVASDKTDKELGTVHIPHKGPEEYKNIWQKVRPIWSYVYDNYYQDYDWFHIGGDDLYLIVENLRLYVESNEVQLAANGGETLPNGDESYQTPLLMGRRFAAAGNREILYSDGGSGYTMNKAALKTLVDALPTCMPDVKTSTEDVNVALCLKDKVRVFPFDTQDDEGGERYMPYAPEDHLNEHKTKYRWYWIHTFYPSKFGLDHCSSHSVAFHYIKPEQMRRMHAILYGHCA